MSAVLPEHAEAFLSALPKRDRRPIWEVANGRYGMDRTRPAGERWQVSRTPWLRGVLDAFQSDEVRELILMAGSQCAKTAPMLMALCWTMKHRPAPTLWITGNDDLAKDASMERITPSLERCPDAAPFLLNNRLDKTTWKIRLRTCTVDVAGAQSSTVLEQNPYRLIMGDEVRQWPPGSLQKVEKRQRSYQEAKRCLFSTPNEKGDEFHERFLAGTREEWHFPCMKCGEFQPLAWKALKRAPVGIECAAEACKHLHPDQPAVRRHICEAGKWVAMNATPAARVRSFHWNAILPPWVAWADLFAEWDRANQLLKLGNVEPLKVFICETLGEPWEEKEWAIVEPSARAPSTYTLSEPAPWDADFTFMTVDMQQLEFWAVIRAWRKAGASRLLWADHKIKIHEVREVAERFKIKPKHVFMDSGFETAQVYRWCIDFGWTAIKGDDRDCFFHKSRHGRPIRRIYSPISEGDPGMNTAEAGRQRAPLFLFASPTAKDILARLRDGQGAPWEVAGDVPDFYWRHMHSEIRKEFANKQTGKTEEKWVRVSKANHLWDCETMQVVAACMAGVLSGESR